MPPQPQQEAVFQEGRILLAVQAYQQNKFLSISATAKAFDVPRNTLHRRIDGIQPQRGSTSMHRLLTSTEEESLVRQILSMDRRGTPPTLATVREMAGLLATQHGKPATVGKNWARNFVNRHDTLKSKYNRKYDYQRAKCEDPELIRAWFQRVQATKAEYGILEEDIYNFDETGFQMGVISTARVVTGADRAGRPRTVQPGKREWVRVAEAVGAQGSVFVICKTTRGYASKTSVENRRERQKGRILGKEVFLRVCRHVYCSKTSRIRCRRWSRRGLPRYGNEHHQSVVDANRSNIMRGHAQGFRELYSTYFITLNYFVVEISTVLYECTWWGCPLTCMVH